WSLVAKHADVHRFVTLLNQRRVLRDMGDEHRQMSLTELIARANESWNGVKLGQPDWSPQSHSVALCVEMIKDRRMVYMILNAYWEPLEFELPPVDNGGPKRWCRWIDTALDSPLDIVSWEEAAPSISGSTYRAEPRSMVVLYVDLAARSKE